MRSLFLFFNCLFISLNSDAQNIQEANWDDVVYGKCDNQNITWWSSDEAIRIAKNVLMYQKESGGWPKNIQMQKTLSQHEKNILIASKNDNKLSTIDNNAVKLELLYLSKIYTEIKDENFKKKIKNSFLKGIKYLIDAQYKNGGWPQNFPLRGNYKDYITYNDNAMINVLTILRHIYKKDMYSIHADSDLIVAAKTAFDKGIAFILNTQFVQNGKLTVWCAQYHNKTLLPAKGRKYELASLSGDESVYIVKLLMSIENPSPKIKESIEYALIWFRENKITGIRLENYLNSDGLNDIRVVNDPFAKHLLARFYTLNDNVPFFCDRDGIIKFAISEIGFERRNNYRWYTDTANQILNNVD